MPGATIMPSASSTSCAVALARRPISATRPARTPRSNERPDMSPRFLHTLRLANLLPWKRNVDRARVTHMTARPRAVFTQLARTGLFLDALQEECLADFGISFSDYAVLRILQ